jgi:hypothetical protein
MFHDATAPFEDRDSPEFIFYFLEEIKYLIFFFYRAGTGTSFFIA